jgi:hypothetical protein
MMRKASFNSKKTYRYWLTRDWSDEIFTSNEKRLAFIGLNPSTADDRKDDNTIKEGDNTREESWVFKSCYAESIRLGEY